MESSKGFLKRFWLFAFIAIFFLIIISGCAKKEAIKSLQDEEVIKQRVMAYWNHRINREFEKMYPYEDPLFRKRISLVAYIRQYGNPAMSYTSFEIHDIKLKDGDNAEVMLKAGVRLKVPGTRAFEHDTDLTEQWVMIDGEWYHVPKGNKSPNQ